MFAGPETDVTHCSQCQAENRDGAKFCVHCGRHIDAAEVAPVAAIVPNSFPLMRGMPQEKPAPKPLPAVPPVEVTTPVSTEMVPQAPMAIAHPQTIMEIPAPAATAVIVPVGTKSPVTATLLSAFLPGGGQCYNRDFKRAALIWGLYVVSFLLMYAVPALGMVLNLGTWVWAMMNAHSVAAGKTSRW